MSFFIQLQCKRCSTVYTLEPGHAVSEFCSTCKRILGRGLQEISQLGLNQRYAQEKEARSRAPWGNAGKDLNRISTFLPGGKP